ncbi:MAG: nucleotidyltransferase family protein [Burkholderiales bacterium]|nr:nucleotidyltransferase family protein [Burkholderiales bacterium]
MKKIFICQCILLAAGRGQRFDPSGQRNKLSAQLASGDSVAASSAKNLLAVNPHCLAVLSGASMQFPHQSTDLLEQLHQLGCKTTVLPASGRQFGMAYSLVHGIQQSRLDADAWMIALADMPAIRPDSIQKLLDALRAGADIAVLVYQGKRGHPVGFSRLYLPELLRLEGDQGARSLLSRYPVTEVVVDDPGILLDIDTALDLETLNSISN